MIKKFVSNALLSMVMDKNAREKLAARNAAPKSAPKSAPKPARAPASASRKPAADSAAKPDRPLDTAAGAVEDLAQTIEMALADARREAVDGKKTRRPAASKTSVASKPEPKREMTPERQRLIEDAISIHQQKTRMLDDLDPEMREKLTVMALMALDPDSLPDGGKTDAGSKKTGVVDDIGGARRTPKKRR